MNDSTKNFESVEDDFDLQKIFRSVLMQSKLIIAIVAIFTTLSIVYYFNAERTYKISSLVQVMPQKEMPNISQGLSAEFLVGASAGADIESIIQLYKSRNRMLNIIEDLNLNIDIEDLNINQQEFIKELNFLDFNNSSKVDLNLTLNDQSYILLNDSEEIIASGIYGKKFQNQYVRLLIDEPENNLKDMTFRLKVHNPIFFYKNLLNNFEIIAPAKTGFSRLMDSGAMLEISFNTDVIENGTIILNYANDSFIQKSIDNESKQARQAISFIDSRLNKIESELDQKKSNLNRFRESNKTVDVDLEIESIVASLKTIQSKLNEIDLEIENARSTLTESNPIFQALINQKATLINQQRNIESEIENLPLEQQEFIDLFGELEISQSIYNLLQNRKLEYSLKEASTIGNMQVIDDAYFSRIVSPTLSIVIISFILSGIIAFTVAVIRGIFFLPLTNPAELGDSNINTPVLGVINKVKDFNEDNERFNQSIESLIVNIETKLGNSPKKDSAELISITSPTAENGKSFVSRNVAKRLANMGKKVLLIDSDYKRGDQHLQFDRKKISKKEFFSINDSNLESFKVEENLYLIPRISRVGSSFDFLYDARYTATIEYLKRNTDYIIFDTAPILSVSDTLILVSSCDLSLCVIRHGLSRINEIKQTHVLFNQVGKQPDGLVYNCYEKPSSYYGYYGLYGNYAYQYYSKRYLYQNYEYQDEKD